MWLRDGFNCAAATLLLLHHVAVAEILPREPQLSQSDLKIKTTYAVQCKRKSHSGDIISVHYNGTLQKGGLQFDSSYTRNQPIQFQLGVGQVIAGWDKGLLDMCIDEERRLVIPPYLAYGNQDVGKIPAGSTLVFETKLMTIEGVDPNESFPAPIVPTEPPHKPKPHGTEKPSKHGGTKVASDDEAAVQSQTPIAPNPDDPDDDEGECRLLGPFALVVQAGLGLLALFSLVWKRYRERPRRPIKIWFFDASKQVFGSVLLHILNLLMSMLSSSDFQLAQKAKMLKAQMVEIDGRRINPCSFYLINIAIDTTIGIPILVVFLRLLHLGFRHTPLARPIESIRSGHYGQPPRATWWLKQALIYFIGLLLMKLCVFFIVQLLPWIAWVGDWALRWTEGNEAIQIAFVMFVFPLIMNGIQYYIIDSFIKERGGGEYQEAGTAGEGAEGGSYQSVSGIESERDSLDSQERSKSLDVATTEVFGQQGVEEARPSGGH